MNQIINMRVVRHYSPKERPEIKIEFKEEVFAMLKACFEAEVALDEATDRMTVTLESGDTFAVTVEKLR